MARNPSLSHIGLLEFLEPAGDAVVCCDRAGVIAFINPSAERLFGYGPGELLGRPLEVVIPERFHDAHAPHHAKFMASRRTRALDMGPELWGRRRDGSEFPAEISLTGVRHGDTRLAIATVRDVSDRRQSERAREQAVEDLSRAQRIANLGSWSWDADADEVTWSAEMYRIFGLAPETHPAGAAGVLACIHLDDRERMAARYAQGVVGEVDYRIVRADGEERTLHSVFRASPGRAGHYVGTVQDVTELRANERALLESQQALRAQTDLLSAVIDNAPIGMASVAPDGSWLRVNRALCEIVGYSEAELLARTFQSITHPDDLDANVAGVAQVLAGELRTLQLEKRYVHRDGHVVWVKVSISVLRDEHGAPSQFISQIEDITAARGTEAELQRERDHSQAIISAMSEGYGLLIDGRITAVNDAVTTLTGYSRAQLLGTRAPFPWSRGYSDEQIAALRKVFEAPQGGTAEVTMTRRDGSQFDAVITARPARNPDGTPLGIVHMMRDVSEQKRYEAELTRMATHDPLTGLANHRAFHERLDAEIARARRHARPLAVAVLDLDHFKQVNDRHGHLAGDHVLQTVAHRLSGLVREGDMLARVGGEEFAWILPETDAYGAYVAAERARRTVAAVPISPVGELGMSAGVCDLAHAACGPELYGRADEALYWAKQRGRNRTFRYSPETAEELDAGHSRERRDHSAYLRYLSELALSIESRHPSFADHAARVADTAASLAQCAGWAPADVEALRQAALLHDIGKLAVPDSIIARTSPLSDAERAQLQTHAAIGAEMLAPALTAQQVAWVRHHHERWDGGGYPGRLARAAIPEGAQLLTLADALDAITHDRPHREALAPDVAMLEIRAHEGTQFAPRAVALLERVLGDRPRALGQPAGRPA